MAAQRRSAPEGPLRTELAGAVALDAACLLELISILNLPLELRQFLRRVAGICARAVDCRSGLVYLWDPDRERLVARAATPALESFEDRLSLELGEGITGWAALNRQPVVITESALEDPRFKLVAGLGEERFQSYVCAPMLGREEELLGVIILHTEAPHEFSDRDLALVAGIASLVGGAVQNLRLHDGMRRQLKILHAVAQMSETVTSDASLDHILNTFAHLVVESFEVDLAAVFLAPVEREKLVLRTFAQRRGLPVIEQPLSPLSSDALAVLAGGGDRIWTFQREGRPELFTSFVLPGGRRFRSLMAAPLVVRKHRFGCLVCYTLQPRFLVGEDEEIFRVVVSQAASAIFNAELLDVTGEESRAHHLLDRLLDASEAVESEVLGAAEQLGCNLRRPHCVLVARTAEPATPWPAVSRVRLSPASGEAARALPRLARAIRKAHPGSVVDCGPRSLRALIPVPKNGPAGVARGLDGIAGELAGRGLLVHGAVSDARTRLQELAEAAAEAEETLSAAKALMGSERRIWAREEVGAYRYLNRLSLETPMDEDQKQLAQLLERDREHGAQLFQTLEVYLDELGNMSAASKRLYIHRNTLRQRLEKIEEILGFDPKDPRRSLALQIALKLVRLRSRRAAADRP